MVERIGRETRGGALFVFFGKRREALKILFHDGSGLCLFYKRLDRGTFFGSPDIFMGGWLRQVGGGTVEGGGVEA